MAGPSIQLIVNADDYGYFPCVSRGIAQAAKLGAVTATGLLANGPDLSGQVGWLRGCENLDLGVHLNLTSRQALTADMASKLDAWGGDFPSVFAMAGQILSRKISLATVREEWRTQIETVADQGVGLRFLNSHEHVHMLPGLFALALELAQEYRIPHLRLTRAEWLPPPGLPAVLRNGLLQAMAAANRKHMADGPVFIGLGGSGKLDLAYLRKLFARLRPGGVYELMCHPGHFDPAEITDSRLLAYHAWEDELALLTGTPVKELYDEFNIHLVNYRGFVQ